MHSRPLFIASCFSLALATLAPSAHAQDPDPTPPAAAPAPSPPPPPPVAPGPAAPSPIRGGCTLGSHAGIDDVDAQTSADVICHELAKRGTTQPSEVRMGRLGGRIIVTVQSPEGAHEDKRLMVNSLEEIPTAATRLAEAASERRPIEETQKVDNVVGGESRTAKLKSGQMGFKGGIIGAMPALGAATGAAPGAALAQLYRAGRAGIDVHLRGGGGGGTTRTLTHFALGMGGHYYFSDGDLSPYLGGGLALLSYRLAHDEERKTLANTGLGAYAELGIEALRTHRTALTVGVRADIPMFELEPTHEPSAFGRPGGSSSIARPENAYVLPVSLMVGVLFH